MSDVNAIINIDIDSSSALLNLKRLESQIDQFNRSVSTSNATAAASQQSLNRALLDGINNTGLFNSKIVPVESSMTRFSRSLDEGRLSLGEYTRFASSQLPGLSRVFKKEFDSIEQVATSRVKSMQIQYLALGKTVDGVTKTIASTPTGLSKGLATDLAMIQQRQQVFNKLLDDGSTKLLNWGKNTQWAGRQLMVGFTLPLAAFGAVASKTFMEIDKATISLKRVYGDLSTTKEELDSNVQAIKGLGKEYTKYGITLAQTIELSGRAAATGATNEKLMAATEQTLRFATLGQMDYNQALDTTISLQTAFAISNEDLGKTVDYLNAVENQTILTMEDMSLAIPRVATVVKGLGGNVQDLAVMMTAMREGGVSAENAANGLKSGLASLINPTKRASEGLGKMGINLNSIINQNKGDLMGIVTEFGTAINKLDEFSRQQVLEQVFGKFQYARMSALFTNITKDAGQAARAMDIAGMSAEELAKISEKELGQISESTSVKFQAAMEQLKMSIAPIGEAFLKGITPIVNMVTKIADAFNNLPDGVKNAVAVLTGIVAGLGPVFLMTIGLLGNGLANLVKGFQFFRKMLAGIKGDASAFTWLAQGELEAVTASKALEGSATNLTDKLLLQRGAVAGLTAEYERFAVVAGIAGARMGGMGGGTATRGAAGKRPLPSPREFATGGTIPGSGNTDTVPAMLTPGEFVINKKATAQNLPLLHAINSGKEMGGFNKGGQIPGVQYFGINNIVRQVRKRPSLTAAEKRTRQSWQDQNQEQLDEMFRTLPTLRPGSNYRPPTDNALRQMRSPEMLHVQSHRSGGTRMYPGSGAENKGLQYLSFENGRSLLRDAQNAQKGLLTKREREIFDRLVPEYEEGKGFVTTTRGQDGKPVKQAIPLDPPMTKEENEVMSKALDNFFTFIEGNGQDQRVRRLLDGERRGSNAIHFISGLQQSLRLRLNNQLGGLPDASIASINLNKGGHITANKAVQSWQTSSRSVREDPEMLGALMSAMRPSQSARTLTRGTTLGLSRGSEFAAADEAIIMKALRSGNVDSLVGREFGMAGPISYTAGNVSGATNAMAMNTDVNRIKELKRQHRQNKEKHLDRLKRIERLRRDLEQGRGPIRLKEDQLAELEKYVAMYAPGQKRIGREIKSLSSKGYENLLIEQRFNLGDQLLDVNAMNPSGTFMGKDVSSESEFISSGSRVRVSGVTTDPETGFIKLILENIADSVQKRALGGPIVPGSGNSDTVPAMLTPGEFVINKKATQSNLPLLHAINNGQTARKNKGGMIGGIQYFAEGGEAQSDRGSASGSGAYKAETRRIMAVGWDSLQTEKLILEAMRDNNELTQSQYDSFKQGETSHITPEVGPNGGKMWRPSNMMADLGLINNYIEAQKGTSKKALGNAKLFGEIQSKTSLSAERLRAELDLLSRGFHATTKESAMALRALSQVGDQTAQKIAVNRVLEARLQGTFYDTLDAPERQYRSDLPTEEKFGKRGKRGRRIPEPETRDPKRPPKVSPQEADRIMRQSRTEAERSLIAERGVPITPNSDYEKEIERRAKEIRTREYERRNKEHGREQARLIAISRQSEMQQPTPEMDMNLPNPQEERNLRRQARRQKIGKGLKGAGGAVGMLSMLPFMMQNEEGKFMGMDANMLGTGMMVGGMAMPAVGSAIAGAGGIGAAAAAVAPIAAFLLPLAAGAIALKIYADKVNDASRAAADMGANLGVTANSLNKIGGLLGTSTPAQRRQQTSLNLSNKELSQSFGEFGSILQSEGGQGFIQELKNATSTERAKKFTDYLRAGVASGMLSSDQARKFADVMGVAVGDSLMSTLAKKGLLGIDGAGSKSYLELSRQRKEALPRADVDALKTAIGKALGVKDVQVRDLVPSAGRYAGAAKQQLDNLKKTIDPELAASAVGSSIQIIQDYSNTVQLAREDLDAGKITQKEYNAIVKESMENQKTYTKTISDAVAYSKVPGATLQAIETQFASLGMTAEEIGKFANSVSGVGEKDIGKYYAEAAAAAVQGMLPSDIQAITDYALGAGKGGTAATTLTDQKYAGQGYGLSALAMNVEQGGILGLDKKQSQQAVDIAFKFTEQGGTVAEYQQFLMTLPENKIVTIQTKLEGLSAPDLYKFTKGFNDIGAKGGIDLAVNVMFDENGNPITGKELSETVKKTDAALNKIGSGKKKVKKEGSIQLLTQIRGADGEQLSRKEAEGQWDSLVKQFGEQKILNLPTDILTKVLDLDIEISADTLELMKLDDQLKTATGEQRMLIFKRMAELKSNKTTLEGQQANLVSSNQPPIIPDGNDDKKGGGGAKDNPLLNLKKSILDQIKMYIDINATMKKLNDQKYKFADMISGSNGVFDKLRGLKGTAGGLSDSVIDVIAGMGPDAAKAWMKKNAKGGKLTKEGQNQADLIFAGGVRGTVEGNLAEFRGARAQRKAYKNLRGKGLDNSVVEAIAGDPTKAKILEGLQERINAGIKGSAKDMRVFINSQIKATKEAELLARAQDPLQTKIDDITMAHKINSVEIDKQVKIYEDQITAINKEITAIQELNSKDQNRIRDLDRQKEMINRQIESLNRANELDQRRAEGLRREDEIRNRSSESLSHELDIMSQQETKIKDTYDKRIKALDEVAKINDHIVNQQRNQLSLAQALSQGDVYAAAAAREDIQSGTAKFAQEQMRTALQTGMENQISGLTTSGGLTRDQAEAQINAAKEQSYQTSLLIRDIEDAIYQRNLAMIPLKDSQLAIDDKIRIIQDAMYVRETEIIGIQTGKLADTQKQLDKELEIKKALDDKFDSQVQSYELQKDIIGMTDAQGTAVAKLSEKYRGIAEQIDNINKLAKNATDKIAVPVKDTEMTKKEFDEKWRDYKDKIDAIEAKRKTDAATVAASITPINKAVGGLIGDGARDSIPAMLTPGEFVMRKASVQKYGMPMLSSMNMGAFEMPTYNTDSQASTTPAVQAPSVVSSITAPVYNTYSVSVNANTNASPDDIANKVIMKIKSIESRSIRSTNGY